MLSDMNKMFSDYDIQALIDDELDGDEQKRVRCYIAKNEWAQKRYEELCLQKQALQLWWQNIKLN